MFFFLFGSVYCFFLLAWLGSFIRGRRVKWLLFSWATRSATRLWRPMNARNKGRSLASFLFSLVSRKFSIFEKTKRKRRSKRRRLPAVSRFYRAHGTSPPLGAAWVSDKGESPGSVLAKRKAPLSIPLLLSSSLKVWTLASHRMYAWNEKNDFVRRGTMRVEKKGRISASPEISRGGNHVPRDDTS